VAAARGDLIARQDADDVALPHRLETQVAFLDAHPEIGLLGSAYHVMDETGRISATHAQPADDALLRWQLLFQNAFCHTSVMLRREAVPPGGLYDTSLPFAQDFDAWSRVMRGTKGYNLSEPLVRYRHHGGAISKKSFGAQQEIADAICRANLAFALPGCGEYLAHASRLRAIFSRGSDGLSHERPAEDMKLYLTVLAAYLRASTIPDPILSSLWKRETKRFRSVLALAALPLPTRLRLWARVFAAERAGWGTSLGSQGQGERGNLVRNRN
jgi:hypothetical protein